MKIETPFPGLATRWIDALLRALDAAQDVSMEAELLKHLPFARVGAHSSAAHSPPAQVPDTQRTLLSH